MIMTLFQKYEYVNQDFLKSKLYQLGDIPSDKAAADEYFQKAIKYASEFMLRYENKGRFIEEYSKSIVKDFMESIDREYKRKFGKGGKA